MSSSSFRSSVEFRLFAASMSCSSFCSSCRFCSLRRPTQGRSGCSSHGDGCSGPAAGARPARGNDRAGARSPSGAATYVTQSLHGNDPCGARTAGDQFQFTETIAGMQEREQLVVARRRSAWRCGRGLRQGNSTSSPYPSSSMITSSGAEVPFGELVADRRQTPLPRGFRGGRCTGAVRGREYLLRGAW